jgi:hypothetical protein
MTPAAISVIMVALKARTGSREAEKTADNKNL